MKHSTFPHGSAAIAVAVLLHAALAAQKLQVYVLAGQSNMEGHAKVATFDYLGDDPKTAPLLRRMLGADGQPKVCDDVWISYLTGSRDGNGEGFGPLTAGYGARSDPSQDGGKIGPEFTFGIRIGEASAAPVLIIKTAWGGKSLHTDFRPPSAGPFVFDPRQLEQFESQHKDVEQIVADKVAATGRYYRLMIEHCRHVLGDLHRVCPAYDADAGYEIAGFVWFQGWNDMVDRGVYPDRDKPGGYDRYAECLAHFIRDVRRDLAAPEMPFVIGVMGVGGPLGNDSNPVHRNFRAAMAAPAALPEFAGNVIAVPTAPYWDTRLAEIATRLDKVRDMARMLRTKNKNHANKDGTMSDEEQRAYVDRYRAEIVGAADEAVWNRGASNAGYHYLGCAKTMAGIGVAFAEALLSVAR
ncbi:MAG: hypothetical protein KDC98_14410 [Planctomycetes bacterium]|nr:hypothetical protein [Planctomycetota bacterium]